MNRVDPISWAGVQGDVSDRAGPGARLPTELLLVAVAVAGQLLGALTDPLAGAAIAIAVAAVLTVRHMHAEVCALRAWEASQPGSAPPA